MNERWVDLVEYPDYAVSNFGSVSNTRAHMSIHPSQNQFGLTRVGLIKNKRQHTKSLAVIVAEVFVEGRSEIFNTPIHLDGDRLNCAASNLVWRPRWFAVKYHRQFQWESFHLNKVSIKDLDTNEKFEYPKEAAMKYGLIYSDIMLSLTNNVHCFPTHQRFCRV